MPSIISVFGLFASSLAVLASPVVPVDKLDVTAYMGTWYQIGDYPQFYERNCKVCTTANYTPNKDGTIAVLNSCRKDFTSMPTEIKAVATQPDVNAPGKLKVKFFGLFNGPYWIIKLGPITNGRYEYAIVSDGKRGSLYVLNRTPSMSNTTWATVESFLKENEFDMNKFTFTTQEGCPASEEDSMMLTESLRSNAVSKAFKASAKKGACPGSAAYIKHAKCQMDVKLTASCADVKAEILARVNGTAGWYDPHNKGVYKAIDTSTNLLQLSRTTGDGKYTDKLNFELSSVGSGCQAAACSESQVFSILDYSTNFCNLHDLYCGSAAGCKFVLHDIAFQEAYTSCSQNDASKCLAVGIV